MATTQRKLAAAFFSVALLIVATIFVASKTVSVQALPTRSVLEVTAENAAEEFKVPAELLFAMAFSETRFRTLHEEGRRSWVRILPWRRSHTIGPDIAAVIGKSSAEIVADPVLGLRAVAAKLASFARELPSWPVTLDDWRVVLARWNGAYDPRADAVFADQIVALANAGFVGVDDQGTTIEVQGRAGPVSTMALGSEEKLAGFQGVSDLPLFKINAKGHRPLAESPRKIRYIVIHTMENTFATIFDYFRWPTTQVGAHYMIRSWDGLAVQLADERLVVFHDACFNEESIGIEHEGYVDDGSRWNSDAMYKASAGLVRSIAARHGIPLDRDHIIGHNEAADCSEHTDPGPSWNWDRYMALIKQDLPLAPP